MDKEETKNKGGRPKRTHEVSDLNAKIEINLKRRFKKHAKNSHKSMTYHLERAMRRYLAQETTLEHELL